LHSSAEGGYRGDSGEQEKGRRFRHGIRHRQRRPRGDGRKFSTVNDLGGFVGAFIADDLPAEVAGGGGEPEVELTDQGSGAVEGERAAGGGESGGAVGGAE